ncbi:MAG TPA: hypothetical protein VG146_03070 [Verrucomicrobiae bacterium]|nr:hypothetical protein [Verrucomicrobiae bacterium]
MNQIDQQPSAFSEWRPVMMDQKQTSSIHFNLTENDGLVAAIQGVINGPRG